MTKKTAITVNQQNTKVQYEKYSAGQKRTLDSNWSLYQKTKKSKNGSVGVIYCFDGAQHRVYD